MSFCKPLPYRIKHFSKGRSLQKLLFIYLFITKLYSFFSRIHCLLCYNLIVRLYAAVQYDKTEVMYEHIKIRP